MLKGITELVREVNKQIEIRQRLGEYKGLPAFTEGDAYRLIGEERLRDAEYYADSYVSEVLTEWIKESKPKRQWWQLSKRFEHWLNAALRGTVLRHEKAMRQDCAELDHPYPVVYEDWQFVFDNDGIAHFDPGNATQECRRHGWRLFKAIFHPQRKSPRENRDREWYDAIVQRGNGVGVNEAIRDIAKSLAKQEGGFAGESKYFWRVKQAYQREKRWRGATEVSENAYSTSVSRKVENLTSQDGFAEGKKARHQIGAEALK